MTRSNRACVLAMATLVLSACEEGLVAPEPADSPEFATMVANPAAVRAEYEAGFCSGDPMPTDPQPGWPYIFGTDADDHIRAGDDYAVRINARLGNDCLVGGAPNNTLFGEEGDDLLLGNGGDDYLDGGPGADVLFGDDGDDYISAVDGSPDIVYAGRGHDVVQARDGTVDQIDCGPGYDVAFVDPEDEVIRCEVVNPESSHHP